MILEGNMPGKSSLIRLLENLEDYGEIEIRLYEVDTWRRLEYISVSQAHNLKEDEIIWEMEGQGLWISHRLTEVYWREVNHDS
jgi:hypothetical protein